MNTSFIHRTVLEELRRDIHRKEIAFLIGPRQAGKTTIMQSLKQELDAAGEKTLFLSLDFDEDRGPCTALHPSTPLRNAWSSTGPSGPQPR